MDKYISNGSLTTDILNVISENHCTLIMILKILKL